MVTDTAHLRADITRLCQQLRAARSSAQPVIARREDSPAVPRDASGGAASGRSSPARHARECASPPRSTPRLPGSSAGSRPADDAVSVVERLRTVSRSPGAAGVEVSPPASALRPHPATLVAMRKYVQTPGEGSHTPSPRAAVARSPWRGREEPGAHQAVAGSPAGRMLASPPYAPVWDAANGMQELTAAVAPPRPLVQPPQREHVHGSVSPETMRWLLGHKAHPQQLMEALGTTGARGRAAAMAFEVARPDAGDAAGQRAMIKHLGDVQQQCHMQSVQMRVLEAENLALRGQFAPPAAAPAAGPPPAAATAPPPVIRVEADATADQKRALSAKKLSSSQMLKPPMDRKQTADHATGAEEAGPPPPAGHAESCLASTVEWSIGERAGTDTSARIVRSPEPSAALSRSCLKTTSGPYGRLRAEVEASMDGITFAAHNDSIQTVGTEDSEDVACPAADLVPQPSGLLPERTPLYVPYTPGQYIPTEYGEVQRLHGEAAPENSPRKKVRRSKRHRDGDRTRRRRRRGDAGAGVETKAAERRSQRSSRPGSPERDLEAALMTLLDPAAAPFGHRAAAAAAQLHPDNIREIGAMVAAMTSPERRSPSSSPAPAGDARLATAVNGLPLDELHPDDRADIVTAVLRQLQASEKRSGTPASTPPCSYVPE